MNDNPVIAQRQTVSWCGCESSGAGPRRDGTHD
jgi:CDGSH-type Zn-finger protein